jgi:hypothetical protein
MPKYEPGAVKIAKEEKLCLVVLEINGRHAKQDSVTFSGPVGPETLREVYALLKRLCSVQERMK